MRRAPLTITTNAIAGIDTFATNVLARVEDLGAFHSLWFTDPDIMRCALTLIAGGRSPAWASRIERTEGRPSYVLCT